MNPIDRFIADLQGKQDRRNTLHRYGWANGLQPPRHSSETEPRSAVRLGAERECRFRGAGE